MVDPKGLYLKTTDDKWSTTMTDAIEPTQNTSVNQADYLQLFMQELTYQDPLKPIDNREFMAQMAQFSALQEAQQANESMSQLLGMTSGNQSLLLLGKSITIKDSNEELVVNGVHFVEKKPPQLMVTMNGAAVLINIADVTEVHGKSI